MDLEDCHQHGAEGTRGAKRRQEAEREGKAAAKFAKDHQPAPQLGRLISLRLEALSQLGEAGAFEPAEELLRAVRGQGQSADEAQNEQGDAYGDSHAACSFRDRCVEMIADNTET